MDFKRSRLRRREMVARDQLRAFRRRNSRRRRGSAHLHDVFPVFRPVQASQPQGVLPATLPPATLPPAKLSPVASLAALPDTSARVQGAFLAVYGRPPEPDEAAATTTFLKTHGGQSAEPIRDLLWALLTSAEFLTVP